MKPRAAPITTTTWSTSLSKKLDAVWRYDQYISNAEGCPHVQELWRDFKRQGHADVERLKQLIAEEVQRGCF